MISVVCGYGELPDPLPWAYLEARGVSTRDVDGRLSVHREHLKEAVSGLNRNGYR